jgi:serine-type D-Ala-D-Ala carboxypeptidase
MDRLRRFGRLSTLRMGGLSRAGFLAAGSFAVVTLALVAPRDRDAERAESSEAPGAELAYQPRLTPAVLERLVAPVREGIEGGNFPGAALAVGIEAREIETVALGSIGWTRNAPPVDAVETRYDLASVTKVVAMGSAVMLLVDEGRMSLDDPVARYLPEFADGPKSGVTVRHLLTHTSGVPAGATLQGANRAQRMARARTFRIFPPAGARTNYSDVGFILLWDAAERAAGEPLDRYLRRKLFEPLGMHSTGFSPGLDCEACAPTGRLRDQSLFRGRPFDPLAQRLDGVSGHSGLFSTAHDLGRFLAMLANGGELDGVRILSREAVAEFVGTQPVGGRYRLAWEVFCPESVTTPSDACDRPYAIGHTGWTGTSIYLEPETGVWAVLLTNRTYEPKGPNRIAEIRHGMVAATLAAGGVGATYAASEAATANPDR